MKLSNPSDQPWPLGRLRNGYLNAKYESNLQPSSPLGRWITPLLPQKRTQDEIYRQLPTNAHHGRVADIGCGNGDFLRSHCHNCYLWQPEVSLGARLAGSDKRAICKYNRCE